MNAALGIQQDDERQERLSLIRDSAAAMVPRDGDLSRIRALRFSAEGMGRESWRQICAMGWVGLRLDEEAGSIGLGAAELAALLEELGKGLLPEPLIEAVMVAGLLPPDLCQQQLGGVHLIMPAGLAQPARLEVRDGLLTGQLDNVSLAAVADAFVVNTHQGLVLVEASSATLHVDCQLTQDGGHLGCLRFNATPVRRLDVSESRLAAILDEASLATSAYLLGCMQGAFVRTLEYLKVRKQFGQAIGSFQVLQHRMVDLNIQIELSRAAIEQAAASIDSGTSTGQRELHVSAARLRTTRAALKVCREAIQLHGAIGYTDEADIGLFLRKVLTLMNTCGSLQYHQQRYTTWVCEEVH